MKHLLTGLGFGLAILIGWFLFLSLNTSDTLPEVDERQPKTVKSTQLPQMVRPVDLTGPFNFAGEPIPMDDFDVRERLDMELLRNAYFHRNTLLLLKRKPRFFPTIERILAEEGVPTDLKYLAVAESGLDNAVSPAGAKGVWQFMAPTGKSYGLEINAEVDERYHLEKATRAAAKYLKDYYKEFGDWRWVAAAYNMGGPNVRKWRKRQSADNIFELDINKETMAYVFRIVALKTILEDPESFGYSLGPDDAYPVLNNYETVTVSKSIADLGQFAKANNTTYRKLKVYNPWLVAGSLPISTGNSYEIKLPR
ncbi:lytic transglycosylase domain-containing protein [Lewinella sp. 4G2]|uniref:lytic transglycosylase domain-containing protein n=1 Tax=Lewinella sp. 4G2 TaxID=1803372 RepID=UPI0007B483C0|nr:lytic transglycosylase domain-containing protein [Lewinella sp. 4G2]OAV45535.1 murein transglycosylase [Lewinella sp. 4G2]